MAPYERRHLARAARIASRRQDFPSLILAGMMRALPEATPVGKLKESKNHHHGVLTFFKTLV
jgi:hypothetical protein